MRRAQREFSMIYEGEKIIPASFSFSVKSIVWELSTCQKGIWTSTNYIVP